MNLDELERLAKAATPGPWVISLCKTGGAFLHRGKWGDFVQSREHILLTDDAYHIAACSPERILAMIECIRAAELVKYNYEKRDDLCEIDFGALESFVAARAKLEAL